MKDITVDKIKYYFEVAKKYKDDIKSSYNETYRYTDVNFTISDAETQQNTPARDIDSTILKSQKFLCNFIMSSVFSKTGSWATIKVNENLLKKIVGNDQITQARADEINKVLDENSNTVYLTNDITNYYTETVKALADCIKVGTGIRKIIELKSNSKPFTYAYQNLDNIYFLEDNLGKPNIIFKRFLQKSQSDIEDMFGHLGIKTAEDFLSEDNDYETRINVIECIISDFDEMTSSYKYHHFIYTDNFEEMLYQGILEYNPYTIFRWQVDSSNPWGIGIGRENLDLFKDLEKKKKLRNKHAQKIVDPPANFYGSIDLINKVSLAAGALNYGGSGIGTDKYGVEPINLGSNLLPVDQDIADLRERIRDVYMAQPLGDVGDTKNRSATEMTLRHEMFRKECSGTYELINTELLEPTFMNAYYILSKKGLLKAIDDKMDYLPITQIQYINELTRSAGASEVMNVINYYNSIALLVPEAEREYILKVEEFIDWSSKKMNIPLNILNTKEEFKQLTAKQQQMEQLQQMAEVQSDIGKRNDVGLNDEISKGVKNLGV
ncbi:hypothetical protein IX317_000363 [Fusobacterium sp. DD29]|uniref:portal protein n=1 Tax=unclassified Fusobacterium TaxID=2648384 RepID=UPI001B8C4F28|nr:MULTISPECIES: portal protein [unclassified Fusobacterium]MBR8748704.1 hypothetical protein [Fusobacterium sp. DD29]MBR8760944.1 hypothetical protein [Fusobacterium sp. DD25]MBR8766983.1 hypothetical protein [Fusobacterium sp. DD43]MBR8770984.1 hypothetical protein [Fusobacterium sp. DD40]MBR8775259.1 hypothetical protein [Fusobacterium sp. DD17]